MTDDQREFYREQFERLWPLIEEAMVTYGETHSKADLWAMIENEQAMLWPAANSVGITTILEHPSGLKEMIVWLAGGQLEEVMKWQPVTEAVARSLGCRRSIIHGRRGWLRALDGYREVGTIMAKDL